ncbi:MAG: Transcriptional regulator, AcrR family [uncultured Paraburkholderia sp.]|uniref:TetR/AcrR family transcriptional regulator n=1 Tax=uncultured Paraburkholderia sp. TaxID=1822466 RepID=UPI0025958E76|nr:TetR/AcrR family transcriptional regulator [uncultured Paraburkholderia sp.]CAH2899139.1 MAG: Transcriptional regulator, AcrR family [uncultured Paraburkholderia sp.]CAH2925041.1 MAG: Transcriptional regulator, AcrR family [uncultured Paraburkholderia sp.]
MARPRGFDEQEVLEAASATFWLKGYEATSTRDLVKSTGLTQPSLYNAFGDKRGLYLRALEHYLDCTLRERIRRFESTVPPAQAITGFFDETIERSVADPHKRGCMLVNSALEISSEDEAFRKLVATEIAEIREFFYRCLVAAQKGGAIAATVLPADAATHLLATVLGMRVLARVDPQREVLTSAAATALALLGLPAIPAKHGGV